MADDPRISRRYRELPREEPPRHVDDAILAAARRAVAARPAPLVTPAGRRRWYFPLAAAAIIVLAVAVTVQVERQQRDVEVAEAPAAVAPPPREEAPPELQKPQQAPSSPVPATAAAPAASPPQEAASGLRESARADAAVRPQARLEVQGAMRQKAIAERAASLATASPEQWLQGIDDLKRQGRHDEAERELAEFRKRYPDYRIPEAITEKFEKR